MFEILAQSSFESDEVAEWLRRWTANPLCLARVCSNLILVVHFLNNNNIYSGSHFH